MSGGNVTGTARQVDGTTVCFTWPCGHTETKNYAAGPRSKQLGPIGVKLMIRRWKDGVRLPPCKRCKLQEKG